jgi:hypothetical protein
VSQICRNDKHYSHYHCVKYYREQRVDAAHPSAAQGLDIEFFEETDAGSDQNGVDRAEYHGPPACEVGQPGKQGEDRDRQQDRNQLSAGRYRQSIRGKVHSRRLVPVPCRFRATIDDADRRVKRTPANAVDEDELAKRRVEVAL